MNSKLIKHLFTLPKIPELSKDKFHDYFVQSDKVMLALFAVQWLVATFITSIMYNTYWYGFVGGALITVCVVMAQKYFPGTRTVRILVAIGMMLFSLIYIQQHLGRIEMHFHIFIAMAILTLYKDVIPIFVAAITTILHHLIFNYLQLYEVTLFDMPVMVFNYGCGFDIVLLHGIFVMLEAFVLGYIIRLQIEQVVAITQSEKEIAKLNESLQHSSLHDSLTGLPNRLYLDSQIKLITNYTDRNNNKFAVLFLDLDHFKNVNDTLGHDFGDELLRSVSTRLQHLLRSNDLISRIGGDEFIIILTDITTASSVERTITKILDMFRTEWLIKGQMLRLSASIGISMYPDDSKDINELMKYSDIAMYKAKAEGRDNFSFFTESLNKDIHSEVSILNDMYRAYENNEFKLYFQPKVEIATGKIIGAEALIRWEHYEKGIILPSQFIHIAENTGFILPLGRFVISEACRVLARLGNIHCDDLHISINVSTRQFKNSDLFHDIKNALDTHQVRGRQLAIEITESIMMAYVENTFETLKRLKDLNVHVCMDDFGTGYSSLAYLQKFAIDSLKIDKSFVDDISTTNKTANVILNTIIAMGDTLDLHVIAEGVETKKQLDYLSKTSCLYYQGYLFSKAIKEEEFITLLKKNKEEIS